MTAYQNFSNPEIEIGLQQLDVPQFLEKNIVNTLKNSRRTAIFPNQIINGLCWGFLSKKEIGLWSLLPLSKVVNLSAIYFNEIMSCSQMAVEESFSVYKSR